MWSVSYNLLTDVALQDLFTGYVIHISIAEKHNRRDKPREETS